jgi:hypothetical protein
LDHLSNFFSAPERLSVEMAIAEKGVKKVIPYLKQIAQHSDATQPAHNIQAPFIGGLAWSAYVLAGSYPEESKAWRSEARLRLQGYANTGLGSQGAPYELHGYGAYAFDSLVKAMLIDDLLQQPFHNVRFGKLGYFYAATMTPDGAGTPTFGDSWPRAAKATAEYLARRGDRYAGMQRLFRLCNGRLADTLIQFTI